MSEPTKHRGLAASEEGATMVEYGLMLLLIATVLVSLTTLIGQITLSFFDLGGAF